MVRSLQQLQTELKEFQQQTLACASALYYQYEYLYQLLGESANKQFILASYQICTQIYPEAFLTLSYSQRDKLQTRLRELGLAIGSQLADALARSQYPSQDSDEDFTEKEENPLSHLKTPDDLLMWCKDREQDISLVLEKTSQAANRLLQSLQVIPSQIPPKLWEMAIQAEENGASLGQSPNILDLLVETRGDREDNDRPSNEDRSVAKVTAIHLRLSEIEFNDPSLDLIHKKLHQSLEGLAKLRQRYRQNLRETAIANAETVWRSSWHEGN